MDEIKKLISCAYCHEDADGYVKPLDKNGHAFISFGMLGAHISVNANGWKNDITINYCPICGRQLLTSADGTNSSKVMVRRLKI